MYDAETIAALESGALVLRDFLFVNGKTVGGSSATFGYWTGEGPVAVNVVPAGQVSPVARGYAGDGALREIPQIVDQIGLEARSFTFGLDHISQAEDMPLDMIYDHNVRVARVEFHRGVFDPDTWNLVANPHLLLAGRVDGAEVDDAAADGEGGLTLTVVGSAIDLTKTNPAMESDEQQRLRSGDRFRRHGDTAGQVETWWGQSKGT